MATLVGIVCGYLSTFLAWSYTRAGAKLGRLQARALACNGEGAGAASRGGAGSWRCTLTELCGAAYLPAAAREPRACPSHLPPHPACPLQEVRLSSIAGTVIANSSLNLVGMGSTILALQVGGWPAGGRGCCCFWGGARLAPAVQPCLHGAAALPRLPLAQQAAPMSSSCGHPSQAPNMAHLVLPPPPAGHCGQPGGQDALLCLRRRLLRPARRAAARRL